MPQPASRAKNLETRNNFYTYNIKGIQFIIINTEYIWPLYRGHVAASNKYELLTWLRNTLKET